MDLRGFDLEHWWKALAAAGVVISVASIPVLFAPTVFIGLGLLFIGLGEWINHPYQVHEATMQYQITSHNRLPMLSGSALDLLGVMLAAAGLVKLFFT